jgi:RNA polymerase sigma-70 factor, ECF subfamily
MVATSMQDLPARDDADLVAQIAAGDFGEPVAELHRRYGGLLYRFGMHQLGDSGLAEELVQECFIRLWRTANRFDGKRGTVATYLFV